MFTTEIKITFDVESNFLEIFEKSCFFLLTFFSKRSIFVIVISTQITRVLKTYTQVRQVRLWSSEKEKN